MGTLGRAEASTDMRVLAVDPGGTTGWMVWNNALASNGGHPQVEMWGECNFEQFVTLLDQWAESVFDVIVCERYTVTANTLKKSRQYEALELIGVLRADAYLRGVPFVLQEQNPAFSTNERLKVCRLYVHGDHGRSAARQLLLYLVKNNIDPGASPEELIDAC
jgi:hypothetical protein